MIVVQISRGVAPVISIVEAMAFAHVHHCLYHPILGMPLVDAKNAAVEYARQKGQDLLLLEDDIRLPKPLWAHLMGSPWPANTVGYGYCHMRDGKDNIIRDMHGEFLSTGNVCTVISSDVIQQLDGPIFEAYYWHMNPDGLDLRRGNPNATGLGSDTGFWWKLRHLPEPPSIECLGPVTHLKTVLNATQDHIHPCEITAW